MKRIENGSLPAVAGNNMELVKPSIEYKDSFIEATKEFQAEGRNLNIDTEEFLKSGSIEKYLEKLKKQEKGLDLPEGYIAHSVFWLVDNGEFMGAIDIRHKLTEHLEKIGGHIGYSIRPTKRKMGYGTKMLALALPEAKKLGIDRVLLTCDDDNIASAKIIESNGGILENKIIGAYGKEDGKLKRRYWIENK